MVQNTKIESKYYTFTLDGSIDSSNAAEFEKKLVTAAGDGELLTLDAENLKYISSAGLRVLLKLRKKQGELTVFNVSPEVYEIMEVTGFTEILKVQKAFRKICVDGCAVIGHGAFGTVYRLNEDTIVKVYDLGRAAGLDFIRREQETARKAFVYGMPTAISFDVVKVGEDYGVVYEMLDADTVAGTLSKNPDALKHYAEKVAELAREIHAAEVRPGDFQPGENIYLGTMPKLAGEIPECIYNNLQEIIHSIPKRSTMIHGDFHCKNIMVRGGELELIDMGDVGIGHPLMDMTSMFHLAQMAKANMPDVSEYSGMPSEQTLLFWECFKQCYFGEKATAENMALLENALRVLSTIRNAGVVIARISAPGIPEERRKAGRERYISVLNELHPVQIRELFNKLDAALFLK